MFRPLRRWLWLAGALLLAAGCQREPAPAAPAAAGDTGFHADHAVWRAQRRADLLRPDGWASLVGLHWIELKAHYVGSSADSGMRLGMGPPRLGLLQQEAGRVYFTPERGVAMTLDAAPLTARAELRSDRDPAPSVLAFDDGKGRLMVIERGGRRALRVWHADAETRLRFGELNTWPPDPAWRLKARFLPHPPGKRLEIMNILGIAEPTPNPGAVEFVKDGASYRLEALAGDDGGLFLIFADGTSGHGSYGPGRYLDAPKPTADGELTLDFNRAYNPPCAFTAYATCPLPPTENRLSLAIAAGEQAYRPAHR